MFLLFIVFKRKPPLQTSSVDRANLNTLKDLVVLPPAILKQQLIHYNVYFLLYQSVKCQLDISLYTTHWYGQFPQRQIIM